MVKFFFFNDTATTEIYTDYQTFSESVGMSQRCQQPTATVALHKVPTLTASPRYTTPPPPGSPSASLDQLGPPSIKESARSRRRSPGCSQQRLDCPEAPSPSGFR